MTSVTFHCNTCGGNRNHAVLAEHVHEWKEEVDFDEQYGPTYIRGKMYTYCFGVVVAIR
jgi:hypothetical protein